MGAINLPSINLVVNGCSQLALIDSGCSTTLISSKKLRDFVLTPFNGSVVLADGGTTKCLGVVVLSLELAGKRLPVECTVVEKINSR